MTTNETHRTLSPENLPSLPLASFDYIVINTSGGKDSQAMLTVVTEFCDAAGISRDRIVAVHSDLGDMEWGGTTELVKEQCDFYGIRLEIVHRELGNILEQVESRGMWPSSKARFCTSDHKRDQIAKLFTRLQREHKKATGRKDCSILNCMGLRAQESPARAKKPVEELNKRSTTESRTVINWHPILDFSVTDIWGVINASGVPHHRAYDLGMPRLSCVFCIFAPKAALRIAGAHNRDLLDRYVAVEEKIGHTFTTSFALSEIRDDLDAQEDLETYVVEQAAKVRTWEM